MEKDQLTRAGRKFARPLRPHGWVDSVQHEDLSPRVYLEHTRQARDLTNQTEA